MGLAVDQYQEILGRDACVLVTEISFFAEAIIGLYKGTGFLLDPAKQLSFSNDILEFLGVIVIFRYVRRRDTASFFASILKKFVKVLRKADRKYYRRLAFT